MIRKRRRPRTGTTARRRNELSFLEAGPGISPQGGVPERFGAVLVLVLVLVLVFVVVLVLGLVLVFLEPLKTMQSNELPCEASTEWDAVTVEGDPTVWWSRGRWA